MTRQSYSLPGFLAVAFLLLALPSYGAWQQASGIASPYYKVKDLDELRASGLYAVLTPDEYVAELRAAPFPFALLHPMCGGIPPELAWSSLRLFENEVMPAFAD